MAAEANSFQIKPPPPPNLTKELQGTWTAWSRIGDREVVREAAAKGVHVEWAETFLSIRKGLELPKTQVWFKNEVFLWISELLARRQVFRATHVLNNIKVDPEEEFKTIFLETCDKGLRDYLGGHLVKLEKLEPKYKESWNFLQLIDDKADSVQFKDVTEELNVRSVEGSSENWKTEIGTELFFKTYDLIAKPFLTPQSVWNFLLKSKNVDLLKLWINVYYTQNATAMSAHVPSEALEHITKMFLEFRITDEMINLNDEVVDFNTRNAILNELSKFGIFKENERCINAILARVAANELLHCIGDVLAKPTSTVCVDRFQQMFIDFCHERGLFSVLNWCDIDFDSHESLVQSYNSKYLSFMCYLRHCDMFNNLSENILRTSEFISDDLREYFTANPLVFVAILAFLNTDLLALFVQKMTHASNAKKFLNSDNIVVKSELITAKGENFVGEFCSAEFFEGVVEKLPFLSAVLKRTDATSLTYNDLLRIHGKVSSEWFEFREATKVPNFNVQSLQRCGYKKSVNFTFYLKQARPCAASVRFACDAKKVYKLIYHHFLDKDIMAGCIAFLDLKGEFLETPRLYVKVANVLHESGLSIKEVQNLLEREDKTAVLDVLEGILMKDSSLSVDYTGEDFIAEIRKHNLAVKFALMHDLRLPEIFLKYLASKNQWVPFLIYVQIHCYPLADVQKLVQHFPNPTAEHLLHALSNDVFLEDYKSKFQRDARKSYLCRIGVRSTSVETPVDNLQSMHSVQSSLNSYASSGSSSAGSDFLENEWEYKPDLLYILIKCHNSVDPPKALLQAAYIYRSPIFAVLATSYEPDSIITNWLTWLSIICDLTSTFSSLDTAVIDCNVVSDIIRSAVEKGYGKLVQDSLLIFLPTHPLIYFMDFLNHCTDLSFDEFTLQKLEPFGETLKQKKSTAIIDVNYEMSYLSNKTWIESTAGTLLATSLQFNFASRYDQAQFLKFLSDICIDSYLPIPLAIFRRIHDVLNCLIQSKCDIKLDLTVILTDKIQSEVLNCIQELVSKKCYDCAFRIAKTMDIPPDFIVIKEWEDKFQTRESCFWDECQKAFEGKVDGHSAVEFFEKCSEATDSEVERHKCLALAHKWAYSCDLHEQYDIEEKMWRGYFKLSHVEYHSTDGPYMLLTEMEEKLKNIEGNSSLAEEEVRKLDEIVERLLNGGNLWQALRLAKIFNHKNEDLDVVVLCCKLAEGVLMPYQMNAGQRLLLNKGRHLRSLSHRRRRTLMSSRGFSSFSSASPSPATTIIPLHDHIDSPFQDTLATLETLADHVRSGSDLVQNILMGYRISVNIDKPYREVFNCTDPMAVVKEALREDCSNKLEVVQDFCLLFKWSKEEIADFFCEELVTTITDHIKVNVEPIFLWNTNLNTDFSMILQLLMENCSILGLKLYTYASALFKSQTISTGDYKIVEISLIIELLICAHDCFTADCNMEGISTILRKSGSIITMLLTLKSWKFIVRLLTGVARYTEMNYVFHILKENDQFEFLLRKGSSKDNGLKVALLKYLKKYCPDDRELYRMVALHFTLFSEIAQLWEQEAKSIVRNLIAISKLEMQNNGMNIEHEPYVLLTNTEGTKLCLNKAMVNYTHATEYHLQGEKLAQAMGSAKQAELLALQFSMLKGVAVNGTVVCVLNLMDVQIASLISTELSFSQSLILVEAYNHKADWTTAIFEQFVIGNHLGYLEGFLSSFPLRDSLVNDLSRKFISLEAFDNTINKNMKDVVDKCKSVRTKYRIASELGFSDLVEELLAGNQLAYLKDTVWKKGYRS